jgi:putative lipoprotein
LISRWTLGFLLSWAVLASGPAYAQDSDPWFGRDKALHFSASASLAVIGYSGAALVTDDRPTRVASATVLALGAGIGKELWDLNGPGDASWRDLTWDVIGTATGVLVASGVDWLIRHFREPDPVAGTP